MTAEKVELPKDEQAKKEELSRDELRNRLKQMHFSDAQIEIILQVNNTSDKLGTDGLNAIVFEQKRLLEARNSLYAILDAYQKNPSIITWAVNQWGTLNLWERILGGVVLTVPTAAVAIVTNVNFLLFLTGTNLITYVAGDFVMRDHKTCTDDLTNKLRNGINDMGQAIGLTVAALDKIRERLSELVQQFKTQNELLQKSIIRLDGEIDGLRKQIASLEASQITISRLTQKLETQVEKLRDEAEKNKALIKTYETQITENKAGYQQCQDKLTENSAAFQKLNAAMQERIISANAVLTTFKESKTILENAPDSVVYSSPEAQQLLNSAQESVTYYNQRWEAFFQTARNRTGGKLTTLQKVQQELEQELEACQREVEAQRADQANLKQQRSRLGAQLGQLNNEHEQQLENAEKMIQEVSTTISTLEQEKPLPPGLKSKIQQYVPNELKETDITGAKLFDPFVEQLCSSKGTLATALEKHSRWSNFDDHLTKGHSEAATAEDYHALGISFS